MITGTANTVAVVDTAREIERKIELWGKVYTPCPGKKEARVF